MQGHKFHGCGRVRAFILHLWHRLALHTLISVYDKRIKRVKQVIAMNGEYYL
jgi:hypothetical protein